MDITWDFVGVFHGFLSNFIHFQPFSSVFKCFQPFSSSSQRRVRSVRTLRHLNLAINDLRWVSAAALRHVVQGHPSLRDLDLAGNDIPEDQLPRL